MSDLHPRVGLGAYVRRDGKLLFGQRKGAHGTGTWCVPGGHLEMGESWEECARREVMEETGLDITNVRFMGATNDIYGPEKHYVTISMMADAPEGEARVMEPDKFEKWGWFAQGEYPEPLFLSTRNFLENGYNPLNFQDK